ncbi:MAG: ATP-binding cassette subfamily B protein [Pseudohongiellaceae bacterium]|jgi:ATP-binding cassette subfamily B protein
MSQPPTAHPFRRLLAYATPHRKAMRLAAACSVTNKVFDLAPPLLIGAAVDIVVEREGSWVGALGFPDVYDQLLVLAGLTVLVWVLESIFEYLFRILWRNLAQTIQHELRVDAWSHVQGLELAWFEDRSTGGLMAVLNDDVNQLERFLDSGANELLQVATTVLVIGGLFFYLAPSVAWMGVAPMPFVLWGSVRFQRLLAPRYAAVRREVGQLNHQLANSLGGIATIKSFTAEAHEAQRLSRTSDGYRQANRAAIRFSSAFSPLIRMVIVVGFTAMLVYGGQLALDGELEVGAYSVMIFLVQRLLWPLTRLGETFDLYQRAMASTTRIFDLLSTEAAVKSGPQTLPREQVVGAVHFDKVSFAYQSNPSTLLPNTLTGLELTMPAGKTTAIVGATGAGKSTVIKLLLRFYDVTGGAITLDGTDLRELSLTDLRDAIGLVSQDVFLFHGTVAENIAYGRRDASPEEIIAAAKAAEAHDFIESLPQGYDTVVGERGQKLSGGQRQRVSLARAVLKDPPVLVLDEATSSVDNETEAAIQRSLARLAVGRTTIVIAHRLSTVRNAECIYVMDGGAVAESGTHNDLIKADGIYGSLWRVQTGEAV